MMSDFESSGSDLDIATPSIHRFPSMVRNVVMNVYRYFSRQWGAESRNETVEKTATATGVSVRSVYRIKHEASECEPNPISSPVHPTKKLRVQDKLDCFDKECVRNEILAFYERGELPTLDELLQKINEKYENYTVGRTTLWEIIRKLGFRYKKVTSGRAILMERDDIVVGRNRYLRLLEKNRQCDPSDQLTEVFLDETWVNKNECVHKCWTHQSDGKVGPKIKTGKGSRFIILHAGGAQGFIPGALLMFKSQFGTRRDYHDSMDHNRFVNWFKTQLLPNLQSKSLIIMDNAPYHSKIHNKVPTTCNRKGEIIEWLLFNNITHDPSMTKAELLQIAKMNKDKQSFIIDEIACEHGHRVLRLPPYYCELNPIELIWTQVKGYVRKRNSNLDQSIKQIEQLTREAIATVTQTDWINCINHTKKIENKYRNKDLAREHLYEQFIINIDDDSSDITSEDLSD